MRAQILCFASLRRDFGFASTQNDNEAALVILSEALGKYRTIRRRIWRCLFRHLLLADFSIYRQ